jgi:calcium/calmodulin-dependent protein kinase I
MCLTVDPKQRPTASEVLKHRWLADEKPHYVPDPGSLTGDPTNLLPHIQKRLDARTRCECPVLLFLIIPPLMRYLRAVRRAVWGITAMKRMSTLAALANSHAGELQANIDKYKEESEKENINEVCPTSCPSVVLPLSNH